MSEQDLKDWAIRLLQLDSNDIANDQRSTTDQVHDLLRLGRMLKLYDAIDVLSRKANRCAANMGEE